MGRAERRKMERRARIASKKDSVTLSRNDIRNMKDKLRNDISKYDVEAMMTCFALAEHRVYGFGKKRVLRTLQYIDDLMEEILKNNATIEDYKEQLEQETGVKITCNVR